jgi:high affinity Mn2+ porin
MRRLRGICLALALLGGVTMRVPLRAQDLFGQPSLAPPTSFAQDRLTEKKNPEEKKSKDEEKDKKNGDKKDEKKDEKDEKKEDEPKNLSVHGQATIVSQGNWKFHSPYVGPNSLLPNLNYRTTATVTLFLDWKINDAIDIVFNPEVAAGRGISNTLGLAGFPNGEATRVGILEPTPYIARLFWRQTIALGDEMEKVEDGPNQVAGERPVDRITIRFGKMPATDIFDDNSYSHDPRTQFLNWGLMYNGAWDYPANARGYNYGITWELNRKEWALRYGVFAEPTIANGQDLDPRFLQANGHVLELEQRYEWGDHPGKLRWLAYLNNAHMGNYRVALREMPIDPDITQTRAYRVKYGFGLNWEQEINKDVGVFARLGWDDGHTEAWAFTEIDATLAFGALVKGTQWCRPDDRVGLAFLFNGLSTGHRDYLAAGGVGFIIGDGALHYGAEEIVEAFYNLQLRKGINFTFDVQGVNNPAYNRERGPVGIAALRLHLEY